ncbi:MAG TPA: AMP-dependent synthetase/ligase [Aeromicrobium sp.]|nr:AMP-dependent synthetase/ligase [Aeromicrobium sp.]
MTRGSLTSEIVERLRRQPDGVIVSAWSPQDDGWTDWSVRDFHRSVTGIAKGLMAHGVQPGDRIALRSRTRHEWTLVDYAIWWAGGVSVPLYETSTAEHVTWVVEDSGVRLAVVESGDVDLGVPTWTIEASDADLDALIAAGAAVGDDELEARRGTVRAEDIATIIYTSGTTGTPKGCPLTHANLRAEIDGAVGTLPEIFMAEGAATLLFLPLAHVFARVIQIGAINAGVRLGLTSEVSQLSERLETFKPTFILTIPRVMERFFNLASQQAYADNRGGFFDRAVQTAIAYSRALDRGKPGPALRTRHAVYERTVYRKLRDVFGGQVSWAVVGGAPLGERLAHFYRGIGMPVLEGYGLTETSAAITVNTPEENRIGTVGKPIPGTEVRLDTGGELQVRGPQVFSGYWNDPSATEACLHDGWFSTGDLADIDEDGFVRILGRRKEILITAGGKIVAPAVLEDRIRAHPYISHCLVVGDGKPFVGALVTIDRSVWTGKLTDPELLAAVQSAVDAANAVVSQAESVRKFIVLDEDWTQENGYLTPSLKVKRSAVLSDFHDTVEALFVR